MTASALPQVVARPRAHGREALRKDLIAGLTVAAVSLPQAMAYALIAGVDPRFGLYSAIVVTAIASIFGSSSHLINGPTNAISLVVFSALAIFDPEARYDAYQATFLLGIMVGSLQILIAVFRLGDLTRYISESVVLGFMAGAGLLVGLGQVGNLLGIPDKGSGHQLLVHRLWLTLTSHTPVNPRALALGARHHRRWSSASVGSPCVTACRASTCCSRSSSPRWSPGGSAGRAPAPTARLWWPRSAACLPACLAFTSRRSSSPGSRTSRAARWRSRSWGCWRRWRSPSRSPTRPASRSTTTGSAWPRAWPTWAAASSSACPAPAR